VVPFGDRVQAHDKKQRNELRQTGDGHSLARWFSLIPFLSLRAVYIYIEFLLLLVLVDYRINYGIHLFVYLINLLNKVSERNG